MSKIKEELFLKKILQFLKRERELSLEKIEQPKDFYCGQASAYAFAYDAIKIIATKEKIKL